LDSAAKEIASRSFVNEADIKAIGRTITRDPETFAVVDIDDINDILARRGD